MRFGCKFAFSVTLVASVILAGFDALAVSAPQTIAHHIPNGSIAIDGRLDEAVWRGITPFSGFHQREPLDGPRATEATEVQVAYDDVALYIGIRAHDSQAVSIVSRIRERDRVMVDKGEVFGFASDDAVAVVLDPFADGRNAMVFASNANGAEFDALITDESGAFNLEWRTVFQVGSTRDSGGYSVEFAIPFRSLRYPADPGSQSWGFNVARVVRRLNEESMWSGWSRVDGGLARVSRAGKLTGLESLPRFPVNVEVKPYFLLERDKSRVDAQSPLLGGWDTQLGFDAKWEATPGVVVDATVNPDFSQAELDQLRINISRFPLFYPEKREFFLENAGIFDFGSYGYYDEASPYLMFFSRRVGAGDPATGQGPVPVRGGVRVSGRVGKQTVGAMTMITEGTFSGAASQPLTNHAVLRWKRDVATSKGNGYVGLMLTDRRSPLEPLPSSVAIHDVDPAVASTNIGIDSALYLSESTRVSSFYARSLRVDGRGIQGSRAGLGANNDGYRVALEHDDGRMKGLLEAISLGSSLRADSGFIARADMRRFSAYGGPIFRPSLLGLRKLSLAVGPWWLVGYDWRKQDLWLGGDFFAEWNSGEIFSLTAAFGHNRADAPWKVSERLVIAAGEYAYKQLQATFNTNTSRTFSFNVQGTAEWMWGGRFINSGAGVALVLGGRVFTWFGFSHFDVDVPSGKLRAFVSELRLSVPLSTRLVFSMYAQHRELDDRFAAYGRVVYTWRPGSDLFFVVSDERGFNGVPDRLARQAVVAKISYLARLF